MKKLKKIMAGEKDVTNRLEFMKNLEYEKLLTKHKKQLRNYIPRNSPTKEKR